MQFMIENVNSDVSSVAFVEKGFDNQLEGKREAYVLIVDKADFIQRFRPIYDDCIEELVRDDEFTRGFHPPYTGAVRYPSLDEFLQLPVVNRMEMINTYFLFDILRLYIDEYAGKLSVQWLIGSLDIVEVHGANLSIKGMVVPIELN